MQNTLPATPGALLGYTKHGKPIRLIGGGSQPTGEPPAPANPPAPAPAKPPAPTPPTGEPPASVPPWERDGQPFDPERAWKLIESLRTENDKSKTGRQTAEQTATQAQERLTGVLKALGLNPDGTQITAADPDEVAQQLEHAQAAAWRSGVELNVYRVAGRLGANGEALLDSMSFIDSLDDLADVDPSTSDFATQLEAKVAAAIERNPNFKAGQAPAGPPAPGAPRPDPSQGSRSAGAPPQRPTSMHEAIAAHYAGRNPGAR